MRGGMTDKPDYDKDIKSQEKSWTPDGIVEMMKQGASPREVIDALDASDDTVYRYHRQFADKLAEARERIFNGETRFKGRKDSAADTTGEQQAGDNDPTEAVIDKGDDPKLRRKLRARRHSYRPERDRSGEPNPYVRGDGSVR